MQQQVSFRNKGNQKGAIGCHNRSNFLPCVEVSTMNQLHCLSGTLSIHTHSKPTIARAQLEQDNTSNVTLRRAQQDMTSSNKLPGLFT
eukprot:scaffold146683_cov21-Tisochrysis_lutea.AAC.1